MAKNEEPNNSFDSAFDSDLKGNTLSPEGDKAKVASLLKFINSVKENAAYMKADTTVSLVKDDEAGSNEPSLINGAEELQAADKSQNNTNKPSIKDGGDNNILALEQQNPKDADTKAVCDVEKKPELTGNTKDEIIRDTVLQQADEQQVSESIGKPLDISDDDSLQTDEEVLDQISAAIVAEQKETPLPVAKSEDTEEDFGQNFNPNLAFYSDEDTTDSIAVTQEQPEEESSIIADTTITDTTEEKTFQRLSQPAEIDTPKEALAKKAGFAPLKSVVSLGSKKKKGANPIVEKTQKSESTGKKQFTNPLKGMSKKAVAAVAAIVFVAGVLATGGVLAAKGLLPVFASNEIYGIFVDGNLVAASNEEGKIEEAIDDFLAHYKTLEEQQSISGLKLSSPYEIRELTKDEIKDGIHTEGKTKATEETQQSGEQTGETTLETTQQTTAATTQVQDGENTTHATANKENPLNKHEDGISVSKNIEELKTVLFYGDSPRLYTVVEGDNLSKIAKREGLTLTELMVPNPDLLEDSTIGIDQDILIVKMCGPLKLSFSRDVTYTEDIPFKTVEEKTDELYEGETKTTQEGKEGIRQEITKYDYEHNVIAVKTPVSDEVIQEATDKIVKVGTKKKTDPSQSSNVPDAPKQQADSSSGFGWPVSGARMSSKFGRRSSPKRGASSYHRGIDLAIASGTPIYASQSGTVTIASYTGGYGNLVEINHGNGLTTRYGHCLSLKVKRGQKVQKGELIALVGSTGVSTGPHVHFEVRKGGTAVNPLNYLS